MVRADLVKKFSGVPWPWLIFWTRVPPSSDLLVEGLKDTILWFENTLKWIKFILAIVFYRLVHEKLNLRPGPQAAKIVL